MDLPQVMPERSTPRLSSAAPLLFPGWFELGAGLRADCGVATDSSEMFSRPVLSEDRPGVSRNGDRSCFQNEKTFLNERKKQVRPMAFSFW